MKTENPEADLDAVTRTLRTDRSAIPWNERFALARRVAERLQAGEANRRMLTLVKLLAQDPKWEVRAAIADVLLSVPDPLFGELTGSLAADPNAYVAQAANRAKTRHSHAVKRTQSTRRTIDEITNMRRSIEAKYGLRAAQQAQRMCDRYSEILVGSMVHDLLSMYTAIAADCLSLMDEVGKRRRVPTRLRANLELAERAIGDMRAYTTPVQVQRQRESLAQLLQRALEVAQENARRQRIDPEAVAIEMSVSELIFVDVSQHLVVMALANILTNAFESFPDEFRTGRIHVAAKVAAGSVEIAIRDNGQGIPEYEMLDPSFLLPGRRNKSKRFSTGYGLPIAARNLAAHGGKLSLKSRPREGTTVTISLPLPTGKE